jgi:hypothetical protein
MSINDAIYKLPLQNLSEDMFHTTIKLVEVKKVRFGVVEERSPQ